MLQCHQWAAGTPLALADVAGHSRLGALPPPGWSCPPHQLPVGCVPGTWPPHTLRGTLTGRVSGQGCWCPSQLPSRPSVTWNWPCRAGLLRTGWHHSLVCSAVLKHGFSHRLCGSQGGAAPSVFLPVCLAAGGTAHATRLPAVRGCHSLVWAAPSWGCPPIRHSQPRPWWSSQRSLAALGTGPGALALPSQLDLPSWALQTSDHAPPLPLKPVICLLVTGGH